MWNDLKLEIDICTKCILEKTRINPIVGEGNKKAEILFVLDSISEEEDVKQKLLIDRNGKYFKKFLEYSKLDLKKCYFTTLTKCYKADNIIEEENISACSVFLDTQIALVNPKYIISVGERPTKALIKSQKVDIKKMFAKEYDYFGITVIPIYDIDYFLNKTTDKEKWKIANIFANI